MEMKQEESVHYEAIDTLKVYAAIGIIMMHVLANGHYIISKEGIVGFIFYRLIPSFTDFVFLFMIFSAFGMCCGYYEKMMCGEISLSRFYRRRYIKIWPFFAMLCFLDVIISPSKEAVYELFANLTLCFGLLPNANISVIGVGWFLGVVFLFYMLFPFFCYLISTKLRAWISFGGAIVLHILGAIYFYDAEHVISGYTARVNIFYCAMFFFAGGLIYLYRVYLMNLVARYKGFVLMACMASILFYYGVNSSAYTLLVLFSLVLICAIGVRKKQNKAIKYISGISMEIYLCHMVIFRIIEKLDMIHFFTSEIPSYFVASITTFLVQ